MNSRRIAIIVVGARRRRRRGRDRASTARSCAGDNVPELGLDTPAPSATAVAAAVRPVAAAPSASGAPATAEPGASAATGDLAGTWTIVSGVAGYRVRETFLQQSAESDAVGRTEDVTGTLTVDGEAGSLRLVSTQITVDMTTLASDKDRRDGQLRGRGIQSDTFPTSTFDLATPVALPADFGSADVAVTLPGKLTLHGVVKDVDDRGPGPARGGRHRRRRREPARSSSPTTASRRRTSPASSRSRTTARWSSGSSSRRGRRSVRAPVRDGGSQASGRRATTEKSCSSTSIGSHVNPW